MDDRTDEMTGTGQIIAWSDKIGAVPCRIVGRNSSNYLVMLQWGSYEIAANLPHSWVFELQEGWTVRGGQIVPIDVDGAQPDGPATLQYHPEMN